MPPLLPQTFWTRISSIVNAEDDETGSREARVTLLQDGWNAFVDHPFTGVGAGQFQNYNPPGRQELWRETHNVELQVLSELGLIGGMAFVWLRVRLGATLSAGGTAFRPRGPKRRARSPTRRSRRNERELDAGPVAACVAAFGGWWSRRSSDRSATNGRSTTSWP